MLLPQFGPCIKHKLLTALDRINEQPEVELFDGVRLVKDPAAARNDAVQDPPSARSADADGNAGLDALVVDKVVNFFKSRSLQFKLLDGEPKEIADGKSIFCLLFVHDVSLHVTRSARIRNDSSFAFDFI